MFGFFCFSCYLFLEVGLYYRYLISLINSEFVHIGIKRCLLIFTYFVIEFRYVIDVDFVLCYRSRTNGPQPAPKPRVPAQASHTMMPSKSTPNLQSSAKTATTACIYTYLQNQGGFPATVASRDDESPPPAPPVRDSSTLKSVKYGPGHEKFPSWPVPAAAETPQVSFFLQNFF